MYVTVPYDFYCVYAVCFYVTYFTLSTSALYYRIFRLEIASKWVGTCNIRRKTGRQKQQEGTLIPKSFFNGLDGMYLKNLVRWNGDTAALQQEDLF